MLAAAAAGPPSVMWHAALLAWILAVPLWYVTKFLVVVAHEGGHALVGVALLRGVKRISFDRRANGVTSFHDLRWPFVILVAAAGYAGPSLYGLLASWLLLHGEPEMVLWASMAFLVLMLFAVRGPIGWIVIPALLVALFQLATKAGAAQLTLAAYVWTWFLLIGAVQRMLVYISRRTYAIKDTTDTARLQQTTLVPSEVWTFVLLLGTVAALVRGGSMLLRMPV